MAPSVEPLCITLQKKNRVLTALFILVRRLLTGRAATRGFIRYLPAYEQGQQKKGNPASGPEGTVNSEPMNGYK